MGFAAALRKPYVRPRMTGRGSLTRAPRGLRQDRTATRKPARQASPSKAAVGQEPGVRTSPGMLCWGAVEVFCPKVP